MTSVHGNVIEIHSEEQFKDLVKEAFAQGRLVVVDTYATWCGPCKMIAPFFVELSIQHPEILFLKVDVDECEDIASALGVSAMPTFYFFKDGNMVKEITGADKTSILRAIGDFIITRA